MSKLNRLRRTWNTKFRQTTVQLVKTDRITYMTVPQLRRMGLVVDVPTLATRGEWPIAHLVSDEALAGLAILYRRLNRGRGWS